MQRKSQKLEILTQLFLNGNQQKEHILDYTLCDFQVVLLKREFSTVFQSYLGSKKNCVLRTYFVGIFDQVGGS